MRIVKLIISLVLLGILLLFIFQNSETVDFKFFTLHVEKMPMYVIMIITFVLGFLVGRLSGWIYAAFEKRVDDNRKAKKLAKKMMADKIRNDAKSAKAGKNKNNIAPDSADNSDAQKNSKSLHWGKPKI